jgi:hypothetical protein
VNKFPSVEENVDENKTFIVMSTAESTISYSAAGFHKHRKRKLLPVLR